MPFQFWEGRRIGLLLEGVVTLALGRCVLPGIPMMLPNYGGVGGTGMNADDIAGMESRMKGAQAAGAASATRPGD